MKKNAFPALLLSAVMILTLFLTSCNKDSGTDKKPYVGIWQTVLEDENLKFIYECEIREDGYFYHANKYMLKEGSDYDIAGFFDSMDFDHEEGATELLHSFFGKYKIEDGKIKVTVDKSFIPEENRDQNVEIINRYEYTVTNDTLTLTLNSNSKQYERAESLLTK